MTDVAGEKVLSLKIVEDIRYCMLLDVLGLGCLPTATTVSVSATCVCVPITDIQKNGCKLISKCANCAFG